MGRGKSVLVVGEKRSTLASFSELLGRTGLNDLRYDLLAEHTAEDQRTEFIRAIVRNENTAEPNSTNLNRELIETRTALTDHTHALTARDPLWHISISEALQRVAELASEESAPQTQVRFSRQLLDTLQDREAITADIVRFAELTGLHAQPALRPGIVPVCLTKTRRRMPTPSSLPCVPHFFPCARR